MRMKCMPRPGDQMYHLWWAEGCDMLTTDLFNIVLCVQVDLLLAEGRDLFTIIPDERTLQYSIHGEKRGMISE